MKSTLAFAVVMLLPTSALAEECFDFSEWKTKVDVQLDSAQINPGAEPGSFVLTYTTEGHDDSYVFSRKSTWTQDFMSSRHESSWGTAATTLQ